MEISKCNVKRTGCERAQQIKTAQEKYSVWRKTYQVIIVKKDRKIGTMGVETDWKNDRRTQEKELLHVPYVRGDRKRRRQRKTTRNTIPKSNDEASSSGGTSSSSIAAAYK